MRYLFCILSSHKSTALWFSVMDDSVREGREVGDSFCCCFVVAFCLQ